MQCRYTKQGVHLFDRESGLNILMDEFECSDEILSVAPANVSIALTNKCNRSCPHCFAPKFTASLDFMTVCSWIDELNKNGCLGVGFGGGEPLLYPYIEELCRYVHDKTSMACTLTTNGDFIEDNTVMWMSQNVNFVRVSTNGGTIDYNQIKYLTKDIQVGINYLLNERTFQELDNTIKCCAEVGVKELLLLPQMKTDFCDGVQSRFISKVDDWLLSTNFPLRVTVSAFSSGGMKSVFAIPGDSGMRQYLHISAEGLVKNSSVNKYGIAVSNRTLIETIKEVYNHENLE